MSNFLERIAKLSPQRLSLLALDLNTKLEELHARAGEPIAVIGLGCRFPGGVTDAESFWRLLQEGRDAVREVPPDRWDINAYYDPDPDVPGKMNTRWGGFLENIDQFDPEFFGISPREASGMDPQQRLLLEVAWEALENAGQSPEKLAGSPTGVFAGLCTTDYYMKRAAGGPKGIDAYVATGNAHSVASGRISYVLGLKGPSISLDTACSSSLVSVHLACQSLHAGECRMALAGGANLLLLPDTTLTLSKAHMMSPVGRCKAFDASADGFVRAEGCGLVVLKRVSDARADGDRVLAVIRGSACNQDGHSSGLTAPNGPSQVAVIREALANAKVQPSEIDYVEAHGTGTSLGDPIEARALAEVFAPNRPAEIPLRIGTVKSNFGHAESAAGIAGLIKTILALSHGRIPPSLHLKKLNPHIDWSGIAIDVPVTQVEWNRGRGQRLAGVSSFGFSGTNAHIVVGDMGEESIAPTGSEISLTPGFHLLPLSARTGAALTALARQYSEVLQANPALNFAAVCRTAGAGRSHFTHRLAVVAKSGKEAADKLAAFGKAESTAGLISGTAGNTSAPGIVFMFTGQGAQYPGMGRELYDSQPVFRRTIDHCAAILQPLLERPLLEVLWTGGAVEKGGRHREGLLNQTEYTQPALFSLEYALAMLWISWGIQPAAVLGHSVGEYVAACVAGIFSLEDGLRLIAARGRLMASLPPNGTMAAVFADESRVAGAIGAEGDRVAIACLNGPENTVISGERGAVETVLARLTAAGVKSRALIVSHAFHSPLMDPILEEFEEEARAVQFLSPQITIVSNTTGKIAESDLMTNAGYWRRHVRQPVRFVESICSARDFGPAVFLEIGPQPILTALARQSAAGDQIVWASSMKRDRKNAETLFEAAAILYTRGVSFEWAGVIPADNLQHVGLPTYPFQRGRYWLDADAVPQLPKRRAGAHPFLGERFDTPAFAGTVFDLDLGDERPAFLNDHRIFGRLIMPSPVFIEMALAGFAARSAPNGIDSVSGEICQLAIREPLFLPDRGSCRIQLIVDEIVAGSAGFRVCSREQGDDARAGGWRTHVTGNVRASTTDPANAAAKWDRCGALRRCPRESAPNEFYDSLVGLGLEFGDRFRGITRIWRGKNEALGEMQLPQTIGHEKSFYRIHPALLDACFHLLGAAVPENAPRNAYLLIGLDRFVLHQLPTGRFWNHTILRPVAHGNWEAFLGDIWLYDDDGKIIAEIRGLQLRRATGAAMARAGAALSDGWFYDMEWREQKLAAISETELMGSPATFIPSSTTIVENIRAGFLATAGLEKISLYNELIPALETLGARFILRAFAKLGWALKTGEKAATHELAEHLGVIPIHHRLFARLLAILAEEGWLKRDGDVWTMRRPLIAPVEDLQAEAKAVMARFPEGAAETAMTARCAEGLDEVLRGRCDPLHLLFPNGDFKSANALYRGTPFARTLNAGVRQSVLSAMKGMPEGRSVNILEIGAGTGGTSSFLLPHLPIDRTRYTFTDVSPLFLSRAQEEFRQYSFADFALLDIENPPEAQGFGGRSFDIVIAANVLHATRDLRKTLGHAAGLLSPGGLLVLLEGTAPSRWVDLTFGLTDGWWRYSDEDLRRDYALISAETWTALFTELGLEAAHLKASNVPDSPVAQQAILLARKPLTSAGTNVPGSSRGYWFFLQDQSGIAEKAAALLRARNEQVVLVSRGERFLKSPDGDYAVNPQCRTEFDRLFQEVQVELKSQLLGVVNFWPLDAVSTEATAPAEWEDLQGQIAGSVIHPAQALFSVTAPGGASSAKLWMVTRDAQNVRRAADAIPENIQPLQAMAWGLARVISLEQPARFGAIIDLDGAAQPQAQATDVMLELGRSNPEDAIAYRDKQRFVPRIIRVEEPLASPPLKLEKIASYLITGGLGGLGLHTMRWLVDRGAGQIVLLSRREFPDSGQWAQLPSDHPSYKTVSAILKAQKSGARVAVVRADVADENVMANLFMRFGKEFPPLRGVIHAAVDMSSCPIDAMDRAGFQAMARAKSMGGWVLHRLTRKLELDFFVLFSSTTALWGVAGLGHYAAANQALDAIAIMRGARGLPALSVRWGTWAEMRVAGEQDKKTFAQAGLRPMDVDRALAALESLIVGKGIAAIVASIDWPALCAVYEARRPRPIFEKMRSTSRSESTRENLPAPNTEAEMVKRLREVSGTRRRDILIGHLRSHAASVLGFDATREIPLDQGLFDMGMDSLMSVELKGRLERSLGVTLPSTLAFNYPTLDALADFLLDDALSITPPAVTEVELPASEIADATAGAEQADYEDMTEDDLEQELLKRLKELK